MNSYTQLPLVERAKRHVITTPRPDGGLKTREIWEPGDELRDRHYEVLDRLHSLDIPMPHAFGGVKGTTIYDNIAAHRRGRDFYLLDLKDAYQSVDVDKLRVVLHLSIARCAIRGVNRNSIYDDLDSFLVNDATIEGVPGLPLGFPASPFLCNLYFTPMDNELHRSLNSGLSPNDPEFVTITRWIDDLTLSSMKKVFSARKRSQIREVIESNGGTINHGKTRRHSLSRGPVTITGMSLYPDRRIAPSPRLIEQVSVRLKKAQDAFLRGELVWSDIDDLNGQKSILHLTKDGSPDSSGQKSVRNLAEQYEAFILLAARSLGTRHHDILEE